MKSTSNSARIAGTLLCLALFASASFAKTHPLNQPSGLAVASNGDLYVANEGGNQILVYTPTYTQSAAKTITQGVNSPTAVDFDPQGNLWVANLIPSRTAFLYFSEYSPAGKQINTAISENNFEYAVPMLAVDGVGDLWVAPLDNNQDSIFAFNAPSPYPAGLIDPVYSKAGDYTAVAARGPWVAFGTGSTASWSLVGATLTGLTGNGLFGSSETVPDGVAAMTFDANYMLYVADPNGGGQVGIQFINVPAGSPGVNNITLTYVPSALAADSARGRLYIANAFTNQIQVYSTTTFELLATIQ
jgi:hypothetical protein